MRKIFLIPLLLAGCTATPVEKSQVVFEVHRPRNCAPLPALAEGATQAERTAFTRTVVQMYAQCAKGDE